MDANQIAVELYLAMHVTLEQDQRFVIYAEMVKEKETKHAMTARMILKAAIQLALDNFLDGHVQEEIPILLIFVILFAETQSFC